MAIRISLCVLFLVVCSLVSSLPGGWQKGTLDDDWTRDALNYAVGSFNRVSNDMFAIKVKNVNTVERQVVAGMNYHFNVDLGRTTCRNGGLRNLDSCPFHEDENLSKSVNCDFNVYVVPWLGTYNSKFKCL